jgi:hypothetical protein
MGMKKKLVSLAAVVAVAGAIGAAPANAAPVNLPSTDTLTKVCGKLKQPSMQTTCNQAVAALATCLAAGGSVKAIISCVREAAPARPRGKLSSAVTKLLGKYDISKLLGKYDISKLLGSYDISKLLAGLKL